VISVLGTGRVFFFFFFFFFFFLFLRGEEDIVVDGANLFALLKEIP
jgi:hypothetical protein